MVIVWELFLPVAKLTIHYVGKIVGLESSYGQFKLFLLQHFGMISNTLSG